MDVVLQMSDLLLQIDLLHIDRINLAFDVDQVLIYFFLASNLSAGNDVDDFFLLLDGVHVPVICEETAHLKSFLGVGILL